MDQLRRDVFPGVAQRGHRERPSLQFDHNGRGEQQRRRQSRTSS